MPNEYIKKGGKQDGEMAIRQENNVKGNGPYISFMKKRESRSVAEKRWSMSNRE